MRNARQTMQLLFEMVFNVIVHEKSLKVSEQFEILTSVFVEG